MRVGSVGGGGVSTTTTSTHVVGGRKQRGEAPACHAPELLENSCGRRVERRRVEKLALSVKDEVDIFEGS